MQSFSERDGDAEHPFFTEVEIFRHIGHMGISLHMKTGAADLESAVGLKKSSSPCFISSMP